MAKSRTEYSAVVTSVNSIRAAGAAPISEDNFLDSAGVQHGAFYLRMDVEETS